MRTDVPGSLSVSTLVASRPSIPGMRTSMMTTSGRRRSATATALAPSLASPTTRMWGERLSERRRPSRTTSWSSAMRQVISFGMRLRLLIRVKRRNPLGLVSRCLRFAGDGKLERELRSRAGARADGDVAGHPPDELAGDVKAEAGAANSAHEIGVEAVEALEDPLL